MQFNKFYFCSNGKGEKVCHIRSGRSNIWNGTEHNEVEKSMISERANRSAPNVKCINWLFENQKRKCSSEGPRINGHRERDLWLYGCASSIKQRMRKKNGKRQMRNHRCHVNRGGNGKTVNNFSFFIGYSLEVNGFQLVVWYPWMVLNVIFNAVVNIFNSWCEKIGWRWRWWKLTVFVITTVSQCHREEWEQPAPDPFIYE